MPLARLGIVTTKLVDAPSLAAVFLRVTDRWFRAWGLGCVAALGVTGVMLAMGADGWRAPFVAAHLAALLALLPLGLALVADALVRSVRVQGSARIALLAVVNGHRVESALVALAFVGAAVSVSQFSDGIRAVRTGANIVTVSAVLILVVRYLNHARAAVPGRKDAR